MLKIFLGIDFFIFVLFVMVKSDDTCDIEIENTLRTLLTPQQYPSIQLQALRKDIMRRVQEVLDQTSNDKRSVSSLARWDNLPAADKRNLEALARAGLVRTLPTEDEDEDNTKRSIANLAKNGQLPATYTNSENKRGIESLARNGELMKNRREIQELLDELYDKRNIGSLARNYNFPSYGKRYLGSLVRNGDLQYGGGKRKLEDDKRNIASIKAQGGNFKRGKRSTFYDDGEYPFPVFQNQNDDYEDLVKTLEDKRFLGSLARSGWLRPSMGKRHIGALARLGWLPTLRNVRRFNRSGRSTNLESCREITTNGKAEDDVYSEDEVSLDENKRFLLQPAVDQILLKKIFLNPRTHSFLSSS